jgi:hypothetical protein
MRLATPAQVVLGSEPGVEYDADSEDELVGPQGLSARGGPGGHSRYKMLHNLWTSMRT